MISEAKYLKAVLRETYRLRPVSIGVGRIMQEDTVIQGYRVPKGVSPVLMNIVCVPCCGYTLSAWNIFAVSLNFVTLLPSAIVH